MINNEYINIKDWINTELQNTKEKFVIEPLDMNLAQLEFDLQKRVEIEVPEYGNFAPVEEIYISKDVTCNLNSFKVICKNSSLEQPKNRILNIEITLKDSFKKYYFIIADGEKQEITKVLNNKNFSLVCKTLILKVLK